ncbi:glycoside hydrolase family 76 protein [Paenibacillus tuaregi]|uniref:glycoside hydrolase family 76 protein n=1 Tax=Paenibacillus tuaregi TaxID=1816681 RepID=UPI000838E03E|nr:glycoside hydrolase family 76 protein [Paenibacillus tuaregi]
MLKNVGKCVLVTVLAVCSFAGVGAAPRQAAAFTSSNADSAMNAFVNVFYDPGAKYFYTNSDHQIHSEHAFGPDGGKYTDFWWEAQLWETVMDAYERTHNSTYRTMIDEIYTGFNQKYPNMMANDFNDDLGWWALACMRAYELTGTEEYRNRASFLFDQIYSFYDNTYGGGIWWKRDGTSPQKNMATNAPMVITAVKLKNATGNPAYLTKAQNIYGWIKSRLSSGSKLGDHVEGSGSGTAVDWDFSYNYGTYMGAALSLYKETHNAAYLTDANNSANYVISKMTLSNTLMYEGENDGAGFKMIFMRYLNQLRLETGNSSYLTFLQQNATQAYNHRRNSDQIIGSDWTGPTGSGYVQSLAAAAGASVLQLVPADGYTGFIAGNGVYEAENALLTKNGGGGIFNESSTAGYSGRGYVAGWNTNGTGITFNVNQNSDSTRTMTIRYAAGAGNASRYISVNGSVIAPNQVFNATNGWGDWQTLTLNVNLKAGFNTIVIGYDSSKGNANYLNVDQIYGL